MSSLSALNKAKMEDVFNMHSGYVGNYSDNSFQNLIIKTTGIDVYAGEYASAFYPSKAKKLRRFVEVESDENVGKVLLAMLDARDAYWQRRMEYDLDDENKDKYADDARDLRHVATMMTAGLMYASNEERLNADISKSKAVLDDLIFASELVCNNIHYNQKTKENNINDYIRDLLKAKGYEQVLDQTRHGMSSTGKDAGSVDLLLAKEHHEVAIIEALRLCSVDKAEIKKHVDKAITNYNALGTSVFLIIYVGTSDFGDFWNRFIDYMKSYIFELECRREISEQVHPNASTRVCNCVLSRDGYDFPVTFLAINVYKKLHV